MNDKVESPQPEQDSEDAFAVSVDKLLQEQQFFLTSEAQQELQGQIKANKRFICIVGMHQEGKERVERFLKIPQRDSADVPFRRQILLGQFLREDGRIKTRGVVAKNLNREAGLPYAIMETFPSGEAEIGFITSPEDMTLLTAKEAQSCLATLEQLHEIELKIMPENTKTALKRYVGSADEFFAAIMNKLDKKVCPADTQGQAESYDQVLNRRLGVTNFRERVQKLLDVFQDVIKNEEGKKEVLVHGDLSPTNLYIYDNGEVEFVDLEWGGICDNEAIATIIDFGNLRARAWNNQEFREGLDAAILEKYRKEGKEDLGKSIVVLGILRSHMSLAGFFENYPLEKQLKEEQRLRREATEADIIKAWQIAGVAF